MKNILEVLNQLSDDLSSNIKIFTDNYETLDYMDNQRNSLYHLIIMSNASDFKKLLGIWTLINANVNPNIKRINGDTFLHSGIIYEMSAKLFDAILSLFDKSDNKFDLSNINNDRNNLFHMIICYINDGNEIKEFAKILKKHNFDFEKVNKYNKTCYDLINIRLGIPKHDREEIVSIMNGSYKENDKLIGKTKSINAYGTILNDKVYDGTQAYGRDKEINKIIVSLATDNKLPILVGPSGVGKTTIVDELAYRIQNNKVPNFLKNKIIYEVHMANILAGTKYRGALEENLQEIFDFVIKNNAILFIDEFHMAFGAGANEYDKSDAASMIKTYIDRYDLQVIGATTSQEYNEYMANDALKRRFELVKINELDDNKLYNIALNTFNNLSITRVIEIDEFVYNNIDKIINILLDLTNDKNRKYDDKIYNPDLLIGIITRAFAYVLAEDDNLLKLEHIIMSINDNERIYDSVKKIAINNINNIDYNKIEVLKKEKIINLSEYKKKHIYR